MNTYLLDFDGTLVDSMPAYVSCMLKILDDANVHYEKDIMKTITPLGVIGSAKYFIDMGVPGSLEEIVDRMQEYAFYEYEHNIPAKENVISSLFELSKRGDSLNVLSASPHVTLDACLKRLGVWDLFENVWSCEDFCTTKTDPLIYKMAAEKIGVPIEDVLFLDDNLDANLTAKSVGMKTCGVYDKSSEDYKDEIRAATDFYIYDFSELLEIDF